MAAAIPIFGNLCRKALFWFDPAPLTQFRDPGGAPSSSGSLEGFGVKKWFFWDGVAGVRTPSLEHQKRTLYPLHHAPPGAVKHHSAVIKI